MMFVAFLLLAVVVVLVRRRIRRKDTRAGLVSERPVFSVEPPMRRLGERRREQL